MRSFAGIYFLSLFITLSSAAAIYQRTAVPDVPALVPKLNPRGGTILKPINLNIFKPAANLEARDLFSQLDPASQAELMFGAPGGNGSVLLANMTLYAPDGQQIVMMESFEGLTSAVDCKGDDGFMSLTFLSKEAFDAAVKKWSFINEKDEDSFLLIANHDGCGEADQRQAYTILNVDNDEATLTTNLTAKPAPWSEVAGTYDLSFGSATLVPEATRRLMARGFFNDVFDAIRDKADDVADGAKDLKDKIIDGVTDGADAVADTTKDAVDDAGNLIDNVGDAVKDVISDVGSGEHTIDEHIFDVSSGKPGERFNVLTDPLNPSNPAIVLDCIDCFIAGKFKVSGKLSVINFNVQGFTINTTPQDFSTRVELEAKIAASVAQPSSLNLTKEIASFPIPSAGISVSGIFDLGAVLTYEVAVETNIAGTANFTFGLQTAFPNDARMVLNLADIDSSTATGFESSKFDPLFEFNSGSATFNVAAISRPKITFGVDVIGVGKLEAGLNLGLPKINTALTAAFDEAGVCEQKADALKTGFKVASSVIIDLGLSIVGKFGPASILDPGALFSVTLWKFEKPIYTGCFPYDIPGLNPSTASATAITPVSVRSRRRANRY